MYTLQALDQEISEVCDDLVNNGFTPKDWVITGVMKNHTKVFGADADAALCCMRETVKNHVNKHFRALKASEDDGRQGVLPGFERLQARYVITRDGDQAIVSIYSMTNEERELKAQELESMAEGCLQHADELRRFNEEYNGIESSDQVT